MTDDILGEVKDYLVLTVGDARRHVTAGGIDKLPDIDVDVAVALPPSQTGRHVDWRPGERRDLACVARAGFADTGQTGR